MRKKDDKINFDDCCFPGKPLTEKELTNLIETSRTSGITSMKDAHAIIRKSYLKGRLPFKGGQP